MTSAFATRSEPNPWQPAPAGCWLLVAGCWLLVTGYWLLVAGRWLKGIHPETIEKGPQRKSAGLFIAHKRSMVYQQLSGGLSQSSPSLTRTS
ncbi:hypothetical protein F3J24_03620 [Comamonas sp. Tr-654]|nr:hypothetical protein [Comamonas sp. Tr-654]